MTGRAPDIAQRDNIAPRPRRLDPNPPRTVRRYRDSIPRSIVEASLARRDQHDIAVVPRPKSAQPSNIRNRARTTLRRNRLNRDRPDFRNRNRAVLRKINPLRHPIRASRKSRDSRNIRRQRNRRRTDRFRRFKPQLVRRHIRRRSAGIENRSSRRNHRHPLRRKISQPDIPAALDPQIRSRRRDRRSSAHRNRPRRRPQQNRPRSTRPDGSGTRQREIVLRPDRQMSFRRPHRRIQNKVPRRRIEQNVPSAMRRNRRVHRENRALRHENNRSVPGQRLNRAIDHQIPAVVNVNPPGRQIRRGQTSNTRIDIRAPRTADSQARDQRDPTARGKIHNTRPRQTIHNGSVGAQRNISAPGRNSAKRQIRSDHRPRDQRYVAAIGGHTINNQRLQSGKIQRARPRDHNTVDRIRNSGKQRRARKLHQPDPVHLRRHNGNISKRPNRQHFGANHAAVLPDRPRRRPHRNRPARTRRPKSHRPGTVRPNNISSTLARAYFNPPLRKSRTRSRGPQLPGIRSRRMDDHAPVSTKITRRQRNPVQRENRPVHDDIPRRLDPHPSIPLRRGLVDRLVDHHIPRPRHQTKIIRETIHIHASFHNHRSARECRRVLDLRDCHRLRQTDIRDPDFPRPRHQISDDQLPKSVVDRVQLHMRNLQPVESPARRIPDPDRPRRRERPDRQRRRRARRLQRPVTARETDPVRRQYRVPVSNLEYVPNRQQIRRRDRRFVHAHRPLEIHIRPGNRRRSRRQFVKEIDRPARDNFHQIGNHRRAHAVAKLHSTARMNTNFAPGVDDAVRVEGHASHIPWRRFVSDNDVPLHRHVAVERHLRPPLHDQIAGDVNAPAEKNVRSGRNDQIVNRTRSADRNVDGNRRRRNKTHVLLRRSRRSVNRSRTREKNAARRRTKRMRRSRIDNRKTALKNRRSARLHFRERLHSHFPRFLQGRRRRLQIRRPVEELLAPLLHLHRRRATNRLLHLDRRNVNRLRRCLLTSQHGIERRRRQQYARLQGLHSKADDSGF